MHIFCLQNTKMQQKVKFLKNHILTSRKPKNEKKDAFVTRNEMEHVLLRPHSFLLVLSYLTNDEYIMTTFRFDLHVLQSLGQTI